DVWIRVENIGTVDASNVRIRVYPKYPFTSMDDSVKFAGTILKGEQVDYKYTLQVAENAVYGTNEISIGYTNSNGYSTRKRFDIEIGSDVVNTKGTVKLATITTEPEVLMPGDMGKVTITLQNSATDYSIELDGSDYLMNSLIKRAELESTDSIVVTSPSQENVGMLGPGDSASLTFSIEVAENATDNVYYPRFNIEGSSRLYDSNWLIPITVDTSAIIILPSEVSDFTKDDDGVVILDVANSRPNTLTGVQIIPTSDKLSFSPEAYYIGTMEDDELFTIQFDASVISEGDVTDEVEWAGDEDMSFVAVFKNGLNNQHTTEPKYHNLKASEDGKSRKSDSDTPMSTKLVIGGIMLIFIIAIVGFYLYMKKKRKEKGQNQRACN
ncbi:MAG: hypothetical protein KAH86_05405, partial [Methanosarcinales archaeon]|nr:hypothetical protein [Methanosarcinales archaeon]